MAGTDFSLGTASLGGHTIHIYLLWTLVLVALVTVAITIYAGEQTQLGERNFPSTNVHGDFEIKGKSGESAEQLFTSDNHEDAGDSHKIRLNETGVMTFESDKGTKGTYVPHLTLTPKSSATGGVVAIAGNATVGSTLTVDGQLTAPVLKAPVLHGDSDHTITEATNAGTITMQADVTTDRTYAIPAPSAKGVHYRFVGQGSGSAADGHDIILSLATDITFDGMITHLATGGNAAGVWGNGTSHKTLTINIPEGYDITLIAHSTSKFFITGTVTSATAPAFT